MEVLYYVLMFFLGWKLREFYAKLQIKLLVKSITVDTVVDEPTVLRLEKHSGVIYAYDEIDDRFLTQGKDLEEIVYNLRKEFPNEAFTARQDNLREMDDYEPI
jgi:hypothetical protein